MTNILFNTDDGLMRQVVSKEYNYLFNLSNGLFYRWGKEKEDNPLYSPYGPEILDLEITEICHNGCKYCYKDNTSFGKNISFEDFKTVIEKVNPHKILTQVAFGLGATGEENPELWNMCKYLRDNNIIPNGTIANITKETAEKIHSYFGACAVSWHEDKDTCYNSIKLLSDTGMKQVNMHYVLHSENYNELLKIMKDTKTDERLKGLNAIVILSLKKKGRAIKNSFESLSQEKFTTLVQYALDNNINIGFDSCSAHKFMNAIKGNEIEKELLTMIEPCESFGMFSSYVNVNGEYFPCSFAEGEENWKEGFNMLQVDDFMKEVWFSEKNE